MMLMITPFAPLMEVSKSGLEIAAAAASGSLIFAGSAAHSHVGLSRILHNGCYIRKVQVDQARNIDQIGNTLHTVAQYIVRHLKGVDQRNFGIR